MVDITREHLQPQTLKQHNNSLLLDDDRLSGKEFRRLKRKRKNKKFKLKKL
jgi:hypothetical protein